MPYHSAYFRASASRSRLAPQVMAYWFTSSRMARAAASFSTSGQGKLGNPCARLIAPCSFASRVMPRITDSVKPWVRRAVCIATLKLAAVRVFCLEDCRTDEGARRPARAGRRAPTTIPRAPLMRIAGLVRVGLRVLARRHFGLRPVRLSRSEARAGRTRDPMGSVAGHETHQSGHDEGAQQLPHTHLLLG